MSLPEPYYHDDDVTLYCGDAREILPQLRGDVVLTDPPYGVGVDYDEYDDTPAGLLELVEWAAPAIRAAAPVALVTCGVANLWDWPQPTWTLTWVVPGGAGNGPWGFTCWQPVLAYGADPYLKNGKGRRPDSFTWTSVYGARGDRAGAHPVPKPLDPWRWLLLRASVKAGDVVIDPFCGSGTTLRAAVDTGRRAVGIELSESYCAQAVASIAQRPLVAVGW